jgi:uncharacterized protein (DUF342 family)
MIPEGVTLHFLVSAQSERRLTELAAQAEKLRTYFSNTTPWFNSDDSLAQRGAWQSFPGPGVLSVSRGETLVSITGHEGSGAVSPPYLLGENVISSAGSDGSVVVKAGITGYLCFDNHQLDIISPFVFSPRSIYLYYICLPPDEMAPFPSVEEIEQFTDHAGIDSSRVVGRNVEQLCEGDADTVGAALIAKGVPLVPGRNARLEFKIDLKQRTGLADSHGKIDFKEKNFAVNVHTGQLLCRKFPLQKGQAGTDLLGNEVPVTEGTDLSLGAGEHVTMAEENGVLLFRSDIDGVVDFHNNILTVSDLLVIDGDVGHTTGHIRTESHCRINGSVLGGYKVVATRGVEIEGNLEAGAVLSAGGDVLIKGGVRGHKTRLTCSGTLRTSYIEEAQVHCGSELEVAKYVMNAQIFCLGDIRVLGQDIHLENHGSILNSNLHFLKRLDARGIGSEKSEETILHAGYDYKAEELDEKINDLLKNINRVITAKSRQSQLNMSSDSFLADLKKLPPHLRKREMKLQGLLKQLILKKKKYRAMQQNLQKTRLRRLAETRISIEGQVYPRVLADFGAAKLEVLVVRQGLELVYNSDSQLVQEI